MPNGLVDKREIEELLNTVETGSSYLNAIMPDLNDNPFALAVEAYLENLDARVLQFRKVLGDWPTLLDREHPAYQEMLQAVQKIANRVTSASPAPPAIVPLENQLPN